MKTYIDKERGIVIHSEITFKKVFRFFMAWILGVSYVSKIEGYRRALYSKDAFTKERIGKKNEFSIIKV